MIEKFERSGMSGAKCVQYAVVKYPTFANWVQTRRRERGFGSATAATGKGTMQMVEAVVGEAGGDYGIAFLRSGIGVGRRNPSAAIV